MYGREYLEWKDRVSTFENKKDEILRIASDLKDGEELNVYRGCGQLVISRRNLNFGTRTTCFK